MRPSSLILGIDPGISITGYGFVADLDNEVVLVDYGAIVIPRKLSMPERLQRLYRELTTVIERHQPDLAAVERLFLAKNARAALTLGQARGVALLAAANSHIPVHEYTPLEVKQAIVGYGRAPKRQVQLALKMLLGLDVMPEPEDAADAIAVALCHLSSHRMREMLAEERPK